jgi:hypothetical protein
VVEVSSAVIRAADLMGILRDWSGPCPSDAVFAAQLGCREDQAAEALAFLEANGLIRIDRTIEILNERKAA